MDTARVGVMGWPVGHTRSPAMHNAAFRALGLEGWRYLALPVPPELFAETARALPGSGYRGVNVTIPHKEAALAVAHTATPAATAIGAANTLTFEDDGAIEAENTDAGGFLDALGTSSRGLRALVLGAGGAARAVVWALREEGAEVLVWNRSPERAAALAVELGVAQAPRPVPCDLLVNATAVGLEPTTTVDEALAALGLGGAAAPGIAVDLVYGGAPTAFERWARVAGSKVVPGTEILVAQGARSVERWTGRPAPVADMRRALDPGG